MRLILLIALLALASIEAKKTPWHRLESERYNFERFESEFHKSYATAAERRVRRQIFQENLQHIIEHNKRGASSFKLGVNHMTDWTSVEFSRLLGRVATPSNKPITTSPLMPPESLPAAVDWRLKGAVTPVKDQGQCGSCWTFAATETMESHNFLQNGEMVELSEQQVASCSPNPHDCGGTGGCAGGTAEVAFAGVMQAGGIASEWTYPYLSHDGTNFKCRFNENSTGGAIAPVAGVQDFTKLPANDYQPLLQAVATKGPVAISVDASSWQHYESGVYNGCNMESPVIDHAVQLVGYGTDGSMDYWLVRNSWTPVWGEEGYVRIQRFASSTSRPCGLDTQPGSGSGCSPGPPNVTVCGMCGILSDSAFPTMQALPGR